jgi:hypothetical protein
LVLLQSLSWLNSVNSLLEKLDGTVEEAIEEQREEENVNLDSILAKRGLSQEIASTPAQYHDGYDEEDENDDDDGNENNEFVDGQDDDENAFESNDEIQERSATDSPDELVETPEVQTRFRTQEEDDGLTVDVEAPSVQVVDIILDADVEQEPQGKHDQDSGPKQKEGDSGRKVDESFTTAKDDIEDLSQFKTPIAKQESMDSAGKKDSPKAIPRTPQQHVNLAPTQPGDGISEKDYKQALADAREAQKEARTLRRHVVSLNAQLETAEYELEAQRVELQQAGERLETNRKKYKEEKEKLCSQHSDLVKTLKDSHDKVLAEVKARHDEQVQDLRTQLKAAEEKRMQEGGDWTNELQNAVGREQELVRKLALLE